MARGWGGHIDGIHVGVVDELLRVGVPFPDMVLLGIGAGTLLAPAHDGHDARAFDIGKGGTAFLLNPHLIYFMIRRVLVDGWGWCSCRLHDGR